MVEQILISYPAIKDFYHKFAVHESNWWTHLPKIAYIKLVQQGLDPNSMRFHGTRLLKYLIS